MRLPFALKGVDVVIYTVFRSLGLEIEIRPVLENTEDKSGDGDDLVGTELHDIQLSEDGEDCRLTKVRPYPSASSRQYSPYWKVVQEAWDSEWRSDIIWLNRAGPKEIAVLRWTVSTQMSLNIWS